MTIKNEKPKDTHVHKQEIFK